LHAVGIIIHARAAREELEIIDHDTIEPALTFQPSRARRKRANG